MWMEWEASPRMISSGHWLRIWVSMISTQMIFTCSLERMIARTMAPLTSMCLAMQYCPSVVSMPIWWRIDPSSIADARKRSSQVLHCGHSIWDPCSLECSLKSRAIIGGHQTASQATPIPQPRRSLCLLFKKQDWHNNGRWFERYISWVGILLHWEGTTRSHALLR